MNATFVTLGSRKRLLVLAAVGSWALLTGHALQADPSDSDALSAAKAWIAQIDAGQYMESYDAGCEQFHQKVTQEKWVLVLKAFRPNYGDVVSRKEVSHDFKPDGVNGLDGQCVVITYDTSFSRLPDGFETVVLKLENGKWRGAAYVAGPKPESRPDGNLQSPPDVETEVQTVPTAHPPQ